MIDTSLISAAFGLAGVAVGGGISFASNWTLSNRKELADREREKLLNDAKFRVASREVGEDLMDGASVANLILHEHKWEMPNSELKLDRWKEHRLVLAAELTEEAWIRVNIAMDAIGQLRRHTERHEVQGASSQDPADDDINGLLAEIQRGRDALKVYRNARSWLRGE